MLNLEVNLGNNVNVKENNNMSSMIYEVEVESIECGEITSFETAQFVNIDMALSYANTVIKNTVISCYDYYNQFEFDSDEQIHVFKAGIQKIQKDLDECKDNNYSVYDNMDRVLLAEVNFDGIDLCEQVVLKLIPERETIKVPKGSISKARGYLEKCGIANENADEVVRELEYILHNADIISE